MPIQNVNGRNVYVLTPKATDTDGKTTSGKNWATLYSDLRWQVWEAQKENEANKIKLDLMSFEAKKDYYDQQKKFLQNRIAELQDIKLKAGVRGGSSKTIDQALRAFDLSAPKSVGGRGASGPKFSRRTVTGRVNSFGDPIVDDAGKDKPLITETVTGTFDVPPSDVKMGNTPVAFQEGTAGGKTVIGPNPALAKLTELLSDEAIAEIEDRQNRQTSEDPLGTGDIDAKIRELENQLGDLERPDLNIDTDLQNRTQRAFEQNVGVIGRGGGPFGLAPRPRRLAPRVDQPRATAFAQDLAEAGAKEKDDRSQLEEYRTSLLKQREEAQALMSTDDAMELGMSPGEAEAQFFLSDVNRQIAAIDERLSQPTIAQKVMADEGFIERKAGEFLLREQNRKPREPLPPRQRRKIDLSDLRGLDPLPGDPTGYDPPIPPRSDDSPRQGRNIDLQLFKDLGGLDPLPGDLTGYDPPIASGPVPRMIPPDRPLRPVPDPPSPDPPSPPPGDPGLADRMMRSLADPPPTPPGDGQAALGGGYVFDPTNGIIFGKDGFPEFANREIEPSIEGQDPPTVVSNDRLGEIAGEIRDSGGDVNVADGLRFKAMESPSEDMQPAGPPQGSLRPTTKQRKDMYSFKVSSEGIKLAQKPKQLARLAKTSLPEEKRPQHIVIVDKLYETNSGKTNAFRLTYDEISRVFANDPKKRTESHKYLVTKDVLEGNKREPLA